MFLETNIQVKQQYTRSNQESLIVDNVHKINLQRNKVLITRKWLKAFKSF